MPLNRGGMGTIAWHACHGLMKANLLDCVLAPEVGAANLLRNVLTDCRGLLENLMQL